MIQVIEGDWVERLGVLEDCSVQCCVTSPPYWGLRDYGVAGQLGLERTPEEYVAKVVEGFREVRRVLRGDGTLWLNLGDSYCGGGRGGNPEESAFRKQATTPVSLVAPSAVPAGLKPKDLCGIPWRVAFALQADGWYLRSDIIWHKPNPMPESVTDRPTKAHEYIFLLSTQGDYFYDAEAIKEPCVVDDLRGPRTFGNGGESRSMHRDNGRLYVPDGNGRNKRTVWTVPSQAFNGDVSYGKCRIASPSCPVHDCQAGLSLALECGERQVAFQCDRNPDNGSRPFEAQEGVVVAIPLGPCASLSDGFFAKLRSTGNRKREGESELGEIFFGIFPGRNECISHTRRCAAKFFHKHENRIWEGAFGDALRFDPSERTGCHIVGTLTFEKQDDSCSCHYVGKVEKRQDHFACFPEDLIKPCILAGTSAKGCCPKCGAPWERVVESTPTEIARSKRSHELGRTRSSGTMTKPPESKTTGWQPTCTCGETVTQPCVVLDPFGGSGTTGQVALELGRSAILIELNPKYLKLARERTNVTPGLNLA